MKNRGRELWKTAQTFRLSFIAVPCAYFLFIHFPARENLLGTLDYIEGDFSLAKLFLSQHLHSHLYIYMVLSFLFCHILMLATRHKYIHGTLRVDLHMTYNLYTVYHGIH